MLHIELYGSINYDPCLGSSVRFSPASPSSMAWAHRRTQPHLWLGIAYLRDRNQDLWLAPTARCLESLISPAQCGDGREVAMICRADIRWWWQDDTWSLAPHLIMTSWDLRVTSLATGDSGWLQDTQGQDHIPSELEMVPGSASFILLSLARLLSSLSSLLPLVSFNWFITTMRVTHHSAGTKREGNSLCQQWNDI